MNREATSARARSLVKTQHPKLTDRQTDTLTDRIVSDLAGMFAAFSYSQDAEPIDAEIDVALARAIRAEPALVREAPTAEEVARWQIAQLADITPLDPAARVQAHRSAGALDPDQRLAAVPASANIPGDTDASDNHDLHPQERVAAHRAGGPIRERRLDAPVSASAAAAHVGLDQETFDRMPAEFKMNAARAVARK